MKREIKFRAWDKRIKKWLWYNFEKYTSESHTDRPTEERIGTFWLTPYWAENKDDIEWVQYTGLKDRNGKEIYEGDIIRLNDIICPITFNDGAFQMRTNENQGISVAVQERVKRFEVIGNIYENPELLK